MKLKELTKKTALFVAAVVLSSTVAHPVPVLAQDTASPLVGKWDLDDSTIEAVKDNYSYAEAVHNGTADYWGKSSLYSKGTGGKKQLTDSDGVYGKAFKSTNYTYIKTDSAPTAVLDENGEMTIALWVKTPSKLSSDCSLFGIGTLNSKNGVNYSLSCDTNVGLAWRIPQWDSSKGKVGGYTQASDRVLTMLDKNSVKPDIWYHVAIKLKRGVVRNVHDPIKYPKPEQTEKALVTYECYLNGVRIDSLCSYVDWEVTDVTSFFHNASTTETPDSYVLEIGAAARGGQDYASNFSGSIDDVRVYNKADSVNVAEVYCAKKEIFVSPSGNDETGDGTIEKPFATINGAKAYLKGIRKSNVTVYLRGGIYRHDETITFDSTDSAMNGCTITYKAYQNEVPIISGGAEITNWTSVGGGVYKVQTSLGAIRNLFVDGEARDNTSSNLTQAADIIKNDSGEYIGLYVDKSIISADMNPADIRLNFVRTNWANCILKVSKIEDGGRYTKVYMDTNAQQGGKSYLDIAIKNSPIMSLNSSFRAENIGKDNLKSGEWYFDMKSNELFYKLLDGENINDVCITAPKTQTILNLDGGTDSKVRGIAFEGIVFEESAWNDGCYTSYKTFQAGELFYRGDEIEDTMVPSGIRVNMAKDIKFERCTVRNFGAAGICLRQDVSDTVIRGCIIEDIADSGINLGTCRIRHELPKTTDDLFYTENITVSDNLIRNIGTTYYGAIGIEIYSTKESTISNNHLKEMPYTGIGVGFFTTNEEKTVQDTSVSGNLIESVCEKLYDGGGIYTLGRLDGTRISNNFVNRVHNLVETEKVTAGYENYGIYLDQGSSQVTVENNVVANSFKSVSRDNSMQKILKNTYTDTSYCYNTRAAHSGDDTSVTMSGATLDDPIYVSDLSKNANAAAIMNGAGISDEYKDIEGTAIVNTAPVLSPTKTDFSLSVYDTVYVDTGAKDDGIPFSRLSCKWEVVSAPEGAYKTYNGTTTKYPEAVYVKDEKSPSGSEITFSKEGAYTLKFTVSDGELSASQTFTFTVSALDSGFLDVAHNASVTSTSVYGDDQTNHAPTVLVDGSSKSFASKTWSSFSDPQQSVTVDLGSPLSLDLVTLKMRSGHEDLNANSNFAIQLSNDADFADFYTVGGADGLFVPVGRTAVFKLGDIGDFRYVRVIGTKRGMILCLDELCAYVDASKKSTFSYVKSVTLEEGALKGFSVKSLKGTVTGIPVAVVYDGESGALKDFFEGVSITAEKDTEKAVSLTDALEVSAGDTLKIFIWDSLNGLHPDDGYKPACFKVK